MKKLNIINKLNNLQEEIKEYCKVNNIKDIKAFKDECLLQGFNIIKYGLSPKDKYRDISPPAEIEADRASLEPKKKKKIVITKK